MTLNEAVLSVLSETEPMDVSSVILEFVQDRHGLPSVPAARDIVTALEQLAKSGEVAQSWSHQSMFRKRTAREYSELIAVRAGQQGEMKL